MRISALALPWLLLIAECAFCETPPSASETALREAVHDVASAALGPWIESIPTQDLERYGFRSAEEAARASLLEPLPMYSPSRRYSDFGRSWIESVLDEPATSWLVPVSVNRGIVCLIVVDAPRGGPLEAVEFGKSFSANRLSAGLRLLGGAESVAWGELRFLSFVGPNVDLLLLREAPGTWRWLRLEGTYEATAAELAEPGVSELLATLRLASDL